jgi:uncharacterized protein YbjQ (UPF0145 family)
MILSSLHSLPGRQLGIHFGVVFGDAVNEGRSDPTDRRVIETLRNDAIGQLKYPAQELRANACLGLSVTYTYVEDDSGGHSLHVSCQADAVLLV